MNISERLQKQTDKCNSSRVQSLDLIDRIKEMFPHLRDKFFLSEELGYFIGDMLARLSWKNPSLHEEMMEALRDRADRITAHTEARNEYATANN